MTILTKKEHIISEGDTALVEFIRAFRKATRDAGVKCLATYRSIERIHKLAGLMNTEDAMKVSLTKGLSKDDIRIIANAMSIRNAYADSLNKLAQ